jgi:hypothetical protein
MFSTDGPDGTGPPSAEAPGEPSAGLATRLFESLCYVLIEKGVLTRNDAMSVVQTVAQIKRGALIDITPSKQDEAELRLLRHLFTSFEALDDGSSDVSFSGGNVLRLRPPLHGDQPAFPEADD